MKIITAGPERESFRSADAASPCLYLRQGFHFKMIDTSAPPATPYWRNLVGFTLLGLLNNVVFAVSNASAGGVLPDAIGFVMIVNTAPGLLVKLAAPLWIDRISYDVKIVVVGSTLAFNMLVLLLPVEIPTSVQLLGIALGDAGSSAGEATCMALTQFYAQPQRHIAHFALGTGFSGLCGYSLKIFVLPALSGGWQILLGLVLVLIYVLVYFLILDTPWINPLVGIDSPNASPDPSPTNFRPPRPPRMDKPAATRYALMDEDDYLSECERSETEREDSLSEGSGPSCRPSREDESSLRLNDATVVLQPSTLAGRLAMGGLSMSLTLTLTLTLTLILTLTLVGSRWVGSRAARSPCPQP